MCLAPISTVFTNFHKTQNTCNLRRIQYAVMSPLIKNVEYSNKNTRELPHRFEFREKFG